MTLWLMPTGLFVPAQPLTTLLAVLLAALPATIALAGYASLDHRTDNRVRAWVQLLTAAALTLWLLAPWRPTDATVRATNMTITLFTYGFVLLDWLRALWRSSGNPGWAHGLVAAVLTATLICAGGLGYLTLQAR